MVRRADDRLLAEERATDDPLPDLQPGHLAREAARDRRLHPALGARQEQRRALGPRAVDGAIHRQHEGRVAPQSGPDRKQRFGLRELRARCLVEHRAHRGRGLERAQAGDARGQLVETAPDRGQRVPHLLERARLVARAFGCAHVACAAFKP
jgi:hypothetical protein